MFDEFVLVSIAFSRVYLRTADHKLEALDNQKTVEVYRSNFLLLAISTNNAEYMEL